MQLPRTMEVHCEYQHADRFSSSARYSSPGDLQQRPAFAPVAGRFGEHSCCFEMWHRLLLRHFPSRNNDGPAVRIDKYKALVSL